MKFCENPLAFHSFLQLTCSSRRSTSGAAPCRWCGGSEPWAARSEAELTFRRAMINIADAGRLGEGEDLNDALLDFFMRLGQFLIPKGGEDEASGCLGDMP